MSRCRLWTRSSSVSSLVLDVGDRASSSASACICRVRSATSVATARLGRDELDVPLLLLDDRALVELHALDALLGGR